MPKKLGISFVLVAFLVSGLGAIAVSVNNQLACEGQLVNHNFAPTADQQIWGDYIISQSFVASLQDLNRIDIFFQTYQRRNTQKVTLRLLDISKEVNNPLQGVEIFRTDFQAADLLNETWHTFMFAPIPDSAGKTFLISLASPDSYDGNAITVGGVQQDLYPLGTAFWGSAPVNADITFRSCYQTSFNKKVNLLLEQMTRARPGVWGETVFYLSLLISYFLVAGFFFWKLIQLIL